MKKLIKKYSPPGLDLFPEICVLIIGSILALLILIVSFASKYKYELNWAKESPGGRTIPYFSDITDKGTIGFSVLYVIMICFIIYRYMYLIKSKSIYLTKRLPVWRATEKLCFIVPFGYMVFCMLLEKLTLIILFILYYILTPDIYLKHNILFDFITESLL